ncbi:hypothetical protein [Pseudomonas kuykendallii]|uniref:hypothetical protein n=1 Tax=Pseudomonas kuykendallii TaxID=1007099 RepID=UPI0028D23685|nr:hypothetical protein [Pseudomonas kuykendallii]
MNDDTIDCPALHQQSADYPFDRRVPKTVRMLRNVTPDPMQIIGLGYLDIPTAPAGALIPVWTNSYGAVAAVLPDGQRIGLKPDEFEVVDWIDLDPPEPLLAALALLKRANRYVGVHASIGGQKLGAEITEFIASHRA